MSCVSTCASAHYLISFDTVKNIDKLGKNDEYKGVWETLMADRVVFIKILEQYFV